MTMYVCRWLLYQHKHNIASLKRMWKPKFKAVQNQDASKLSNELCSKNKSIISIMTTQKSLLVLALG